MRWEPRRAMNNRSNEHSRSESLPTLVEESVKLYKSIFLTGQPGVGKTTVLLQVLKELSDLGYKAGGMVSREVREGGIRVGFEIVNVQSGRKGWLAHVNQPTGPQVSKYRVNLNDLAEVGVKALSEAAANPELKFIVIDEIGPMELFSVDFKKAVKNAVEAGKPLLGTIHYRARDELIDFIKSRPDVKIVEVTYANRAMIHKVVIDDLLKIL
jgi:nucleoside-triphosphatase